MPLTTEEREYWESKGFTLGAKVRPTGTSWNASTSSRKWMGAVGEIVPGARPKPKGIPVQFKREDWHFPEIFVYHPTNLELMEPKMPANPKPALVKPTAPKPEPSLYKAIRERLETKDRETLHDRTKKAAEAVENLLEGDQSAEVVNVTNIVNQAAPAPAAPWSLDGLVVDPSEEAVGQWGFFWDAENVPSVGVTKLDALCPSAAMFAAMYKYQGTCGSWAHFAYIPDFPGAELLKCTTGYEAT